jgi:quinol monooxygenase YgiN
MTLTIEVRAKSGKANELYQTLQALLPTMRKAKGCLNCLANPAVNDERVHVLSCDWDSRTGFEEYIRTGSGSALIGAIDLLGEETRIQMGSGAKWESSEVLKRIRREA